MDQRSNSTVDEKSVQALASHLQGQLIRPEDSKYDVARAVWNGVTTMVCIMAPPAMASFTDSNFGAP